jgi:hypothetical protein
MREPSGHPSTPLAGIVGLVTGVTSEQSAELRQLLWRRLRGCAVILFFLIMAAQARLFLIESVRTSLSSGDKVLAVCGGLASAGYLLSLWRQGKRSVRQLRFLELFLLVTVICFMACVTYVWLTRGVALAMPLSPQVAVETQHGFWGLYPDYT